MSVILTDTLKARVVGAAVTTEKGLNVGGALTATSFVGDGSNITGLANTDFINATQLNVIGVTTSSSVVVGSAVTINSTGIDAVSGVITASSFVGDGSNLTGVTGFATALSDSGFLSKVFQTPKGEPVAAGTSVQITGTEQCGNIVFTRIGRIDVGTGATITVSTGTTFIMNVLNVF